MCPATSALRPLLAAALLCASALGAPPCAGRQGGGCAAWEETDEVAALHLQRRRSESALLASEETAPPIKWRDATEVVRDHLAALESAAASNKSAWPWYPGRPLLAPNVQAPPQPPPYGPFRAVSGGFFPPAPYPPSEELREPHSVDSENGLLDTVLVVDWGWVEYPKVGIRFRTRLYNGTFPGPTLRFQRGDRVRIRVINRLHKDMPDHVAFPRREGQGSVNFTNGVPPNDPTYQNVGQIRGSHTIMKGMNNNFHHPNATNLHTHGVHVSNFQPQDNVLVPNIPPGGEYTYEYDISPYHAAGTSWYHPHLHGSVQLQIAGGLAGALIVEDDTDETPPAAEDATNYVAVIQQVSAGYFGPEFLKFYPDDLSQGCFKFGSVFTTRCTIGHRTGLVANFSGDKLWKVQYAEGFGYQEGQQRPTTEFFVVNGQYRPTISIKTGEFVRLRLILATANDGVNLIFNTTTTGANADDCEMYLIGKDNVPLAVMPRLLSKGIFLASGNRANVLVRCSKAGSYPLANTDPTNGEYTYEPYATFMFINVTGEDATLTPPTPFSPSRPRYLQSLLDLQNSDLATPVVPPAFNRDNGLPVENQYPLLINGKTMTHNLVLVVPDVSAPATDNTDSVWRYVINNMTFSPKYPIATLSVAQVYEVFIAGLTDHTWHMHTNPVQFQAFSMPDYLERFGGWYQVGDWGDTVSFVDFSPDRGSNYSATVRFQTDCYSGILVLHCHIIYHEDMGMITWFNTTGKEHTVNPNFSNDGDFLNPPPQCTKPGQQCAPPYCSDYVYAEPGPQPRTSTPCPSRKTSANAEGAKGPVMRAAPGSSDVEQPSESERSR